MLNDQLIDKRIVERNIKKGRVDAAEYRRMLAALPDLTGRLWRHEESRAQAEGGGTAAAEPARSAWSDESAQPAPLG
jgi:hypothetical protein